MKDPLTVVGRDLCMCLPAGGKQQQGHGVIYLGPPKNTRVGLVLSRELRNAPNIPLLFVHTK